MIELTTEDRERIEQAVQRIEQEVHRVHAIWVDSIPVHEALFKMGEYATIYEREECNKIIERATADQTDTIVMLDQKVKQLEAERSEVIRRIKSILKASTVHDKISILEELEQLLNSLKTK